MQKGWNEMGMDALCLFSCGVCLPVLACLLAGAWACLRGYADSVYLSACVMRCPKEKKKNSFLHVLFAWYQRLSIWGKRPLVVPSIFRVCTLTFGYPWVYTLQNTSPHVLSSHPGHLEMVTFVHLDHRPTESHRSDGQLVVVRELFKDIAKRAIGKTMTNWLVCYKESDRRTCSPQTRLRLLTLVSPRPALVIRSRL